MYKGDPLQISRLYHVQNGLPSINKVYYFHYYDYYYYQVDQKVLSVHFSHKRTVAKVKSSYSFLLGNPYNRRRKN